MATIIFDADDTLINTVESVIDIYNLDFKDNLRIDAIQSWEISKYVKPECGVAILDYFNDPRVYERVSPVPNAVEAVSALRGGGTTVLIVTANPSPYLKEALCRLGFFGHGNRHAEDYVVSSNKNIFSADILIDDRPKNVQSFNGLSILRDRPWNADMPWPNRVDSMTAALRLIFEWKKKKNTVAIPGLGKSAPTYTNAAGGKQSVLEYRFDLFDPRTMFKMARVLYRGAEKYGVGNWKNISIEDNINHAISHLYAYLAGDEQDEHLTHAACRAMFAAALDLDRRT